MLYIAWHISLYYLHRAIELMLISLLFKCKNKFFELDFQLILLKELNLFSS